MVAAKGISVATNPFYGLDKVNALVSLSHSGKMKGKGIIVVEEKAIEHERRLGTKF